TRAEHPSAGNTETGRAALGSRRFWIGSSDGATAATRRTPHLPAARPTRLTGRPALRATAASGRFRATFRSARATQIRAAVTAPSIARVINKVSPVPKVVSNQVVVATIVASLAAKAIKVAVTAAGVAVVDAGAIAARAAAIAVLVLKASRVAAPFERHVN